MEDCNIEGGRFRFLQFSYCRVLSLELLLKVNMATIDLNEKLLDIQRDIFSLVLRKRKLCLLDEEMP